MGSINDNGSGSDYAYRASKAALNIGELVPPSMWFCRGWQVLGSASMPAAAPAGPGCYGAARLCALRRPSIWHTLRRAALSPRQLAAPLPPAAPTVNKSLSIDLAGDDICCVLLHPGAYCTRARS